MDFIKNNVNKKTIKSILILFLLIFSGYILADLVCTVIMEKTVIKPAVVKVTPQSAESKPFIKPLSKYTELLKPVFKEYTDNTDKEPAEKKDQILAEAILNPDETKKPILSGTICNDITKVAIIVYGKNYYMLKINETIGGLVVSRITSRSVTFNDKNNASEIVLYLGGNHPGPTQPINTPSERKAILRSEVTKVMGSPNELAKEIAFAPFQKNNEPYGIKFLRMKPEGFFGGIGLRQNDILLSINAQRLKTPEDFFRIYQLFNNENNLSFKVDRDGQIMDFVVDIR